MTQPKRGLGRGLGALLGGSPERPPSAAEPVPPIETVVPEVPPPTPAGPPVEPVLAPSAPPVAVALPEPVPTATRRGVPEQVDIDLIAPNPEQPRTHFEPEQLRELAESIREHGILQPLVVSRDADGGFRLIAGERRLQAARLADMATVPVIFREADNTELLELALIENIQRADLNAIEEASAYRRLIEEHGLTQEEVAQRVGKGRATVANALRLLQLEPEIRRSLVSGEITEGHARALLGITDARARVTLWREVVRRRMSVRDTEALVRKSVAATPAVAPARAAQAARRDAAYAGIETRLRRHLGTRVTVQPQRTGAKITIDCYSSEEFDHVVGQLLGEDGEDG